MQIVNMHRIPHDVVTVFVCLPVRDSTLDTASRHPHSEAARMVIAAIVIGGQLALAIHRASEFPAPNNERLVQ